MARLLPRDAYSPGNFLALPPEQSSFATSRVVVLPVPYDAASSYRSGARDGPSAIIKASQHLEDFDPELETEPCAAGIHTLPELEPTVAGPTAMARLVTRAVRPLAERGKLVVTLGGDHSLTAGAVAAYRDVYPDLSVLYLDAHADMRESYQGSRNSHACSARRIHERCPIVLAGVRSLSTNEWRYIREQSIPLFRWPRPEAFDVVPAVLRELTTRVYISVDLDVLDPSLMAGVGTPEPGGMQWEELLRLLRAVAESKAIVGCDLMELAPELGPSGNAYVAAKLAYKLMGYALAGKANPLPG
jgi:agmatinase